MDRRLESVRPAVLRSSGLVSAGGTRSPQAIDKPRSNSTVLSWDMNALQWVRSTAKVGLRRCWAAVPIQFRAAIKHRSDLIKIDYPNKDIYVNVSSPTDIRRAASCAKEPGTVRWIEETVGGVFYDIGANIGAYSLVAWASSNGHTQVVAFEPGFSTFPQLCRNIIVNGCADRVIPLNIALSDQCGPMVFRYSSVEAGAAEHIGLSSGLNASGQSTSTVVFEQQMWTHTLDDAISQFGLPAPQHIKIDVDGHELAILRGAHRTLTGGTVRSLQIEIGTSDPDGPAIQTLLGDLGYIVQRVSPHPGGPIADYVFVRAPTEAIS
jgi:FkbM family methyltransferase